MEHFPPISGNSQIFVLTGAGISKESGLDTFRDNDGLWNNHRVEDVATPEMHLPETLPLSMIFTIIDVESSIMAQSLIRLT